MNVHAPRLGIDIGEVIMAHDNDAMFGPFGTETYDEQAMLAIEEVDGAVEAISRLVLSVFSSENVWLISKGHSKTEAKTRRWLEHHQIFARAALLPEHTLFCWGRPDKAVICQGLGIGYFVDNRPDVLFPMDGIVPHRYLFSGQPTATGAGLTPVADWAEAETAIREDFYR